MSEAYQMPKLSSLILPDAKEVESEEVPHRQSAGQGTRHHAGLGSMRCRNVVEGQGLTVTEQLAGCWGRTEAGGTVCCPEGENPTP